MRFRDCDAKKVLILNESFSDLFKVNPKVEFELSTGYPQYRNPCWSWFFECFLRPFPAEITTICDDEAGQAK